MLGLWRLLVACGMATKMERFYYYYYWFRKRRGGKCLSTKLRKEEGAHSLDYSMEALVISTAVLI